MVLAWNHFGVTGLSINSEIKFCAHFLIFGFKSSYESNLPSKYAKYYIDLWTSNIYRMITNVGIRNSNIMGIVLTSWWSWRPPHFFYINKLLYFTTFYINFAGLMVMGISNCCLEHKVFAVHKSALTLRVYR